MIDLTKVLEIKRNNKLVQKIETNRIPNEYQEVEYIESTGTQYILTDIIPTNTMGVYIKVSSSDVYSDSYYFGSKSTGDTRYCIGSYRNALYFGFNKLTSGANRPAVIQDEIIEAKLNYKNSRTNIYNEFTENIDTTIDTSVMSPISIFAGNFSGTISLNAKIKLYKFEVSEGTDILYKFIPCYKKSDNTVGLYEVINNNFYTNKGTGIFGKGNDIIYNELIYEGYKELEIEETLPIQITNSGNPAINYKIYGDFSRVGTPSKTDPATMYSVGDLVTDTTDPNYGKYKIPVRAIGKNILPRLIKGKGVNSATGEITTSNLYATSDFIEVDMDNYYCFSGLTDKCMSIAYAYNENKEYLGRTSGVATTERYFDKTYFVHSTTGVGGDIKYIIVGQYVPYTRPEDIKYVNDITPQLELGREPTFYEPYKTPITTNIYLDEPLRGIVNSSETKIDYIDFNNQKVYRNVTEKIFTGSESWGKVASASNPDYFRYYMGDGGRIYGALSSLSQFCNYFVWGGPTTGNQQQGISLYVSSDNNYIRIRDSELTTTTLIRNFMKEKYDAGEPVKFVYTTKIQIAEDITLPPILLQKGLNIISIGTELQPSDMYVKYKGKIM